MVEIKSLNWTVTLIISIFFGIFGVDRLMMGHYLLALIKFLTAGGLGVWWVIDVVLIAIRHRFKDVEWNKKGRQKPPFFCGLSHFKFKTAASSIIHLFLTNKQKGLKRNLKSLPFA